MKMVAYVMADPNGLQRMEIGRVTIDSEAFIQRRIYDVKFDKAVREAQGKLLQQGRGVVPQLTSRLTTTSGAFSLAPLKAQHRTNWTKKSEALRPELQLASLRVNDAWVAYQRSEEDYQLTRAVMADSSHRYMAQATATDQAYDLVGKSGMGLTGKAVFHTLGLFGMGKKAELKKKLKDYARTDFRLPQQIKILDKKIKD
jgi:hypothetical protein